MAPINEDSESDVLSRFYCVYLPVDEVMLLLTRWIIRRTDKGCMRLGRCWSDRAWLERYDTRAPLHIIHARVYAGNDGYR
jgi:hypothetical protein